MAMLKTGDAAPRFALEGIDGKRYALGDAGGEPTFLGFFKNSCPTCQMTFPFLQRLFERLEGAPVRLWGISQDDTAATEAFARQWEIQFPLLPDESGYPVSSAFGIISVPTLYLVEPEGRISWSSMGFVKSDLETLAGELRRRLRIPGITPLFVAADGVPEMKPG